MKKGKAKNIRIFSSIFVLLILFFGLGVIFLEAGICEDAFWWCWHDPWLVEPAKTVFCGSGYLFCKKYVESQL